MFKSKKDDTTYTDLELIIAVTDSLVDNPNEWQVEASLHYYKVIHIPSMLKITVTAYGTNINSVPCTKEQANSIKFAINNMYSAKNKISTNKFLKENT
jgi:hypothetical protein